MPVQSKRWALRVRAGDVFSAQCVGGSREEEEAEAAAAAAGCVDTGGLPLAAENHQQNVGRLGRTRSQRRRTQSGK